MSDPMLRWIRPLIPVLYLLIVVNVSFAQAPQPVEIVILRAPNSLTIYIPPHDLGQVSLQGLRLEVTNRQGEPVSYGLERASAFAPLFPYSNIPTPICLHVERSGNTDPLPLECDPATTLILTQRVADVDVFWYDEFSRQELPLTIVRVSEFVTICPAQNSCELEFLPGIVEYTLPGSSPSALNVLGISGADVTTNAEWIPYFQQFGGAEMALVPIGCFTLGSNTGRENERPPHQQCIDQPFWIDRYEISNGAFGGYGFWPLPQQPREVVNWFEASEYCAARGARLPTEVEWEYAARGPDNLIYSWGNNFIPDNATYGLNSGLQTNFVGERPGGASWVGALDLIGNVYEWTSTLYYPYPYNLADNRENSSDTAGLRVVRGGSWMQGADIMQASLRVAQEPDARNNTTGFRCARDFQIEELDFERFLSRELLPTPSPTPLIPQVRVLSGANLRSGPGGEYTLLGSAREGQLLVVIGRSGVGESLWYQVIDLDGRTKWISGTLVMLSGVSAEAVPEAALP
jgi:formylglycine-generating enzyme required for sulfatase activity